MSNMNSNVFWFSNFFTGRLVGGRCICSVVGWSVVSSWLVGWWGSVVSGQLVGGFNETRTSSTSDNKIDH